MTELRTIRLACTPITAAAFRPFGTLIEPRAGDLGFGPADADLELGRGRPRLYIMTLENRGLRFDAITRHRRVTQCLAAMGGAQWFLAVAPPADPEDAAERPAPDAIRAFAVPGTVAVKLHRGTWHAGPYFAANRADFLNLELSDTNEADHDTCNLADAFAVRVELAIG